MESAPIRSSDIASMPTVKAKAGSNTAAARMEDNGLWDWENSPSPPFDLARASRLATLWCSNSAFGG
jgi:hypothetical protein